MAIKTTVFSEYEVRELVVKLGTETCSIGCIGSLEEETEVIKVTKKCRGVVAKKRTRGTGSGTLKLTAHMPRDLYDRLMAMKSDKLKPGVTAYGRTSVHPEFTLTGRVFDEDEKEKLKAWPVCVMNAGPASKVENGAEEVAELEIEIGYSPDKNGFGHYECDLEDATEDVKNAWMESFTPELVKAAD